MEKKLAVIMAAYNEEAAIETTVRTVEAVLTEHGVPHCLILVDDGSKDETWQKISALASEKEGITGVRFSRNFGKEAAIHAGLFYAKEYPCCVVMDADLQHPPLTVVEMYRKWEAGAEIVEGVKEERQAENALHRACAGVFYCAITRATGIDLTRSSDFKLLDRKVVLTLLNLREKNAFFRALTYWTGYRMETVAYVPADRVAGTTKWSFGSLVRYSISNITSFTTAPLQIITILGFLMFGLAILQGIESLVSWLSGTAANGFTTVILLQLIIGSMTMISLGIIGCFIGKIYEEVKGRPRYIVEETTDVSD